MEGNGCLVHTALTGWDERAIAGPSYMSSLGLRNPKDGNGCKLRILITNPACLGIMVKPATSFLYKNIYNQGVLLKKSKLLGSPQKHGLAEKESP